ncbi:MAG: CCA tRNA nucleotidyltransferase [Coriobacteriales bacterium]|jgi:tRNA nucleotidyltransferase (CCA-adding enzyme)
MHQARDIKIEVPARALRVLEALEAKGHEAYVVGGCVRDAILGRVPNDWDVTTSARPEQTKAAAHAAGFKTADTGIKHGTVTVIVDHEPFEVTTYRSDGAYSDGRHPDEVRFLDSLEGDLARRDFTVNALAYNPSVGLVDEFDGVGDLNRRVLRAVGEPHRRFEEDALRILRGIRFSAQLEFALEKGTAQAIHDDRMLLEKISAERIASEIEKLACAPGCVDVMLGFSDVLTVCIPEIEPSIGFDQRNPHHCYTVWEHCVRACSYAAPDDLVMRLAALFHDIGKPACYFMGEDGIGHFYGHREVSADLFAQAARRLKLPRKLSERVELLVRYHDANLPTTAKGMRHWAVKFSPEVVRQIFELHRCDIKALAPGEVAGGLANVDAAEAFFEKSIEQVSVFSLRDLAVNGRDLIELGCAQGPKVGEILSQLLNAVVDGQIPNDRQALLQRAKQLIYE